MSARVIARLFARDNFCPECRRLCDLMTLILQVEDIQGKERCVTWSGCWKCFMKTGLIELKEELNVKDIINIPTSPHRRRQNKKARKREEQAAEDIGGRRVSGSGSQEAKGDARNAQWMVEDKHTSGKTYTLSREVINKAVAQANKTGRNAVIRVGLSGGANLAVCLWSDFVEGMIHDRDSSTS